MGADETSTLPYLLEFLSVKDSGVDKISLSPDARKDRIIETLKRMSLMASQIRPLIFAIEDLHWIDKSSEDVFKAVLDNIAGERVFMIFTCRPEFVHTWGAKSYHNQVNLNRLSNRESLAIVTHLLGTENIDRNLEEVILEKTEGIPFFIEEFVKSSKDLRIIEKKNSTYHLARDIKGVAIPSTIQDVIMARVDTLPEEAKEVLQTASVIEREFKYALIRKVLGLSERELLSRLSVLKDAELLFERGIYPETTYIFKHALTQEVVYHSILTRRKKKLHEDIGNSIEGLYKENIEEHYEILAEHFITGENYTKGSEYGRLAGKKAEKAGSFKDAIVYGNKQVTCLEKLPQTEEVEKKLIDARTVLGLYYFQTTNSVEAKAAVYPIVDLATERNYKRRVSQINCVIGQYTGVVEEDYTKAFEYLERALSIGGDLNDLPTLVLSNICMATFLSLNCDFKKSHLYYEKALEINVAANVLWGESATKAWIAWMVYSYQGKINLGYAASEEAVRIADESGDIFSKTHAYPAHGWSYYHKGYLKEAKEHFLKGADFCERINMLIYAATAHFGLGITYFDMGEYKLSQRHYKRAISIFRHGSMYPSWTNHWKMALILARVMNSEKDINVYKIFKYYEDNKTKLYEGWMLSCIGEFY